MFGIQPIHIVVIVLVAFLIFGGAKLPELGRSVGKAISEFRKGTKEAAEGFRDEVVKTDAPVAPSTASIQPPAMSQAVPVTGRGNFCIQCGAPNPAEARFCASCGTKLANKS